MTAFVYFMKHLTEPRVKIGKAVNLENRWNQLGNCFNFQESFYKECEDESSALALEKKLHKAFLPRKYEILEKEDGYSEWFHEDVLHTISVMIDNIKIIENKEIVQKLKKPRAPRKPRVYDTFCYQWPYEAIRLVVGAMQECDVYFFDNKKYLVFVGNKSVYWASKIDDFHIIYDIPQARGGFNVFGGRGDVSDNLQMITIERDYFRLFEHLMIQELSVDRINSYI
jgi:hypothetical protein